ncbi:putative proline racemase [Dactylonectria estremocensis]|uniref:trans-L-3-hydroxyproline dehydratase n=1 Tax=Dactylonectria estremocensis TaxID=1079267 RepID=A0A9P9J742_9HYPO|nr:putative proline racemase [Dactylonectria estremocensis]
MATITALLGHPGPEAVITTPIRCVDMHTTGEPTRIVYAGYPSLQGTLAKQRALASSEHDHIRRRLILEPRGHRDMYGAVLRQSTELVDTGEADMGVLFMTNDGYSNMCGHATIALGRFLIDTHDPEIFPRRHALMADAKGTHIRLHLPCGIVTVTIQTLPDGRSDPFKPVSFVSVPSFATAVGVPVPIPIEKRWRVGKTIKEVTVDIAFGGAFFCMVEAPLLYDSGSKQNLTGNDLNDLDEAAFTIISLINEDPELRKLLTSNAPITAELGKLYAAVVVFKGLGKKSPETKGVETGICYFDNHQIDRSPTGSAVCARAALAYAKREISLGDLCTYQSLVSNNHQGEGSFAAKVVDQTDIGVRIQLEAYAYYTGAHVSFAESGDILGDDGFLLGSLSG